MPCSRFLKETTTLKPIKELYRLLHIDKPKNYTAKKVQWTEKKDKVNYSSGLLQSNSHLLLIWRIRIFISWQALIKKKNIKDKLLHDTDIQNEYSDLVNDSLVDEPDVKYTFSTLVLWPSYSSTLKPLRVICNPVIKVSISSVSVHNRR